MWGLPAKRVDADAFFLVAAGSQRPAKAGRAARAQALASQSLPVVHLLASSLRVDRSLASAIRFAARHSGGVASEELERLEWAVRIRHFQTVDEGVIALADSVGACDPEFKRALLTLHGAESEATREGLERRLDRAYDIVMGAEERRRESLAATLERPTQVLFGIGVVLPLVLASLLPMLQITGGALGLVPAGLLLVVAAPGITFVAASKILDRNFLAAPLERRHVRPMLAAALAGPLAGGLIWALTAAAPGLLGFPPPFAVAGACAGASATAGLALSRRAAPGEEDRRAMEQALPDLLHAVGTRMVAGRSAEHALLESVEASKDSTLAARLRGLLFDVIVGRRSLGDAIERDDEVRDAPRVFPALRLLASAAGRDTEAAGRVVLHLSEFERLRAQAGEALRAKAESVVGTTRGTVTIFAPMILGITAGMFGLLSKIGTSFVSGRGTATGLDAQSFAVVVLLYLCLEVALADWFAARLLSSRPVSDFGAKLARDVPVALSLFVAALVASSALF